MSLKHEETYIKYEKETENLMTEISRQSDDSKTNNKGPLA